jgi:ADP-dependent NAD(P)H-hydrate dehydratase / NAD(P)H-hydrate epimerase
MQILTAQELRAADEFTIEKEEITSSVLMERAAKKCFEWIQLHLPANKTFAVLCGNGNNGGDGWVIARLLKETGRDVAVFALAAEQLSADNALKRKEFLATGAEFETLNEESLTAISRKDILVDALFGTGLNRPLEREIAGFIEAINKFPNFKVAIDTPSGFFADTPMPDKATALEAAVTLCFHAPRLMYFFAESEKWVGEWLVIDIGLKVNELTASKIAGIGTFMYTMQDDLQGVLTHKPVFAHKGSNGHALLVGGMKGKMGAMVLAAKACLRSGTGLCSLYIPAEGNAILQTAVPEAMVFDSEAADYLSVSFNAEHFSAIGFGPGAGKHEETGKLLKYLIQTVNGNLLVDADGLNILAENQTWLSFLPSNTVLTPHPGELDRLCGKANSGFERLENARKLSLKTGAVIVLKGAFTAVCSPSGAVYFNSTGNNGMAKGGSGDVLSGIITALLAQGLSALNAARLGVFVHGLAGDFAAAEMGKIAMNAGDIINNLPAAWKMISGAQNEV